MLQRHIQMNTALYPSNVFCDKIRQVEKQKNTKLNLRYITLKRNEFTRASKIPGKGKQENRNIPSVNDYNTDQKTYSNNITTQQSYFILIMIMQFQISVLHDVQWHYTLHLSPQALS
jgi:hypothetical protein